MKTNCLNRKMSPQVGDFIKIEFYNGYSTEGIIQTIDDYSRRVTINPSKEVNFQIDYERIKSARIIENKLVKFEEVIYA